MCLLKRIISVVVYIYIKISMYIYACISSQGLLISILFLQFLRGICSNFNCLFLDPLKSIKSPPPTKFQYLKLCLYRTFLEFTLSAHILLIAALSGLILFTAPKIDFLLRELQGLLARLIPGRLSKCTVFPCRLITSS